MIVLSHDDSVTADHVDDRTTYYGLMPEWLDAYLASGRDGWTFSLRPMAQFGVADVIYLGDGDDAQFDVVRANVHVYPEPEHCA